jgi:hypothetical protein
VQITSGAIAGKVNIDIGPQGIAIAMLASLSGISGVRDGKKIGPLEPVTLGLAARMPSLDAGPMDLTDLSVKVNSSFMTLTAQARTSAGPTPKAMSIWFACAMTSARSLISP